MPLLYFVKLIERIPALFLTVGKFEFRTIRHECSGSLALTVDPAARNARGKHMVLVMLAHLHRFVEGEIVDGFARSVGHKIMSR